MSLLLHFSTAVVSWIMCRYHCTAHSAQSIAECPKITLELTFIHLFLCLLKTCTVQVISIPCGLQLQTGWFVGEFACVIAHSIFNGTTQNFLRPYFDYRPSQYIYSFLRWPVIKFFYANFATLPHQYYHLHFYVLRLQVGLIFQFELIKQCLDSLFNINYNTVGKTQK